MAFKLLGYYKGSDADTMTQAVEMETFETLRASLGIRRWADVFSIHSIKKSRFARLIDKLYFNTKKHH
ncbi:hypothetical protein V2J09_022119 [Rumex salicifolius]